MAIFPSYESINYGNPVVEEMQFKTLFSNYDDLGEERRKRKWKYPKRLITLQYNYLSKIDGRTIFQFYLDRSGAYEAFSFFKYEIETYTGEYVGSGDSSTTLYSLPCKNSYARTLYVNDIEQVLGADSTTGDYTYTALGGLDGEDTINFNDTSIPEASERITIDFSGNLKIRCRFKEDNMSFDTFYNKFRSFGIQLQGLLNT